MAQDHRIVDDDNRFIIDGATRLITNLTGNHPSVMQFDHNSEVLTFQMPRFMEGHDMTLCDEVKVLYKNTGSGTSASNRPVVADVETINDLEIDEDENSIVFSWTIPEFATLYAGKIVFQFKFVCHGDPQEAEPKFKLYTEQYSFVEVRPSLDLSEILDAQFPNLLDEIESRLIAFKNEAASPTMIAADMVLSTEPNAPNSLNMPVVSNGDGSIGNPKNPKVLYFPEGFGGYNFWMACVVGSSSMQSTGTSTGGNPYIACSNDMVTWATPDGVTNPLATFSVSGYPSDIHLVYNSDTALLEIWFTYTVFGAENGVITTTTKTIRATSSDGIEWVGWDTVYSTSVNNYSTNPCYRSPVAIYENGVYKMWICPGTSSTTNFEYYESVDGTNWELKTITNLKAQALDIIHTDSGYEAFFYNTDPSGYKAVSYHSISADGISWPVETTSLFQNSSTLAGWDSMGLNRVSAIKDHGMYYVFYTGSGPTGLKIGLTVSSVPDDVESLRGYVSGQATATTMVDQLQTLMSRFSTLEKRLSDMEESFNDFSEDFSEWASSVEERLSGLGAPANTESE